MQLPCLPQQSLEMLRPVHLSFIPSLVQRSEKLSDVFKSSSGTLDSKLRGRLILMQPHGHSTGTCTAGGPPSSPLQCLLGPCQVHSIPTPISFQGNLTGLPLGARITHSALLGTVWLRTAAVAGHMSVLSYPRGISTHCLPPCLFTLRFCPSLDTPCPRGS